MRQTVLTTIVEQCEDYSTACARVPAFDYFRRHPSVEA